MGRNWISRLFRGNRSTVKNTAKAQPAAKPDILQLEDRSVPAVTSFTGGVLTIDLNNTNESVDISNDGTDITLTSTDAITGDGNKFTTANVNKLVFTDAGGKAGQTITFANSTGITLAQGLSATGIETVNFNNVITTTGTSAVSIVAPQSISITKNLTGGSGGVSLTANGTAALDTDGILVSNAIVTATGAGTVSLTGTGGGGPGVFNIGVQITGATAKVTSGGGAVTITGTGGSGTDDSQVGVRIDTGGTVTAGGTGTVTVLGTGGANSTGNDTDGVDVLGGSIITSNGGNVIVTGIAGGTGGSNNNWGVWVNSTSKISSGGNGSINVTGTSGTGTGGGNVGIGIEDDAQIITTGNGGITLSGTGGQSSITPSSGVLLRNNSSIKSGSTLAITGKAGGGAKGVSIEDSTLVQSGADSPITLTVDNLQIDGGTSIDAANGTVSILTLTPNTKVNLGGADVTTGSPLVLGLSNAELGRITAKGGLTIGSLTNTGGIQLTSNVTLAPAKVPTLILRTAGDITQDADNDVLTVETLDAKANQITLTDANANALHVINKVALEATGASATIDIGIDSDVTVLAAGLKANGSVLISSTGKLTNSGTIESATKNVFVYVEDYTGTGTVKAATGSTDADSSKGTVYISTYKTSTAISLGTDNVAGKLSLSNTELQNFTAGRLLQIGDKFNTDLEVNAQITAPTGFSKLILGAAGAITDTAAGKITVGALGVSLLVDGGTAVLDTPGYNVQTFAGEGDFKKNSIEFFNTGALKVDTVGLIVGVKVSTTNGAVGDTGTVTIKAASPLTIAADVSALGDITLTAGDSAAVGDTLTVNAGVTVESTDGDVTLNAGDNIVLTGSSIKAKGATGDIFINLDLGTADVGVGVTTTIDGAALFATEGTTIQTGADQDTITLSPSANSIIGIDGGNPAANPNGDTLIFDGLGNTVTLDVTNSALNVVGFDEVTFSNFENLEFINTTNVVVDGSNGDDFLTLFQTAGVRRFTLDTFLAGAEVLLPAGQTDFTFNGKDGNDRMLVRFNTGVLGFTGGITFNGNDNTTNDIAQFEGDGTTTVATYLSGAAVGSGSFTSGSQVFNFATTEKADAFALLTLNATFAGAQDLIALTQGTQFGPQAKTAIQVSGTSGGTAIVPLAVHTTGTLTVNTTTDDSGADDTVTVNALTNAPGVTNLSITTANNKNVGADAVDFVGTIALDGSLTVTGNDINFKSASIQTAGGQTYTAAIGATTTTDVTFTDTNSKNIVFDTPLDGGKNVTVNTAGQTQFNQPIGSNARLSSLTTNAAGSTLIATTTIKTTGAQTYNDPVTLAATTTLDSNGSGDITFGNTVDGAFGLTVNTTGVTKFQGAVGGTTALTSVTTNATGSTQVNGGSVKTSGAQTFNDAVSVGAATTFSSTASGNITFNNTLDGAFAVDVNTAGTTAFNNVVGGTTPLTSLTTDAPGTTTINTVAITTTGTQTYNDPVTLAQTTNLTGTTVTFNGTLAGGTKNLTVTGNAVFGDAAADTVTGLGTLTVTGNTTVNTNTVTSTGKQDYQGNLTIGAPAGTATLTTTNSDIFVGGTTTLASNLTTSNGTGNTTFTGKVDGTFDLTVNSTGNTTFTAAVGGTTPLRSVTTDAGGKTNVNGGTVATTKTQTYNDAVVVGANTTFSSTGAGADGNINFVSTLDGAKTVAVNTAGTTTFGGAVGGTTPLTSLTTDAAGTTAVNGGSVKTTGTQTYGDAVTVGADATFTSTAAGNITFGSTLDGAFNVTVNTDGNTIFNGQVGNTTPLTSLTTDANGTTQVNGGLVKTTGAQAYNDAVTVGADATFTSTGAGDIVYNSTLDGAFNVVVNTAGETKFMGQVGGTTPLTSLTTDATGKTDVNGGLVRTTGFQKYQDPVILSLDTLFDSTGSGNITFEQTLDGAFTATVNTAGVTTFGGKVGNTTPLVSLTTDAPGSTQVNGGLVSTTKTQTFNDPVTVGADATFTSTGAGVDGNINFNSTLDGGFNVDVNTAGTTTFAGKVGDTTPLTSLTTDAAGTTAVNGGLVQTTGNQTFNDPVTVGANTAFTSKASGNIIFNNTLNGAFEVDVNTAGTTKFQAAVGGATPLTKLTTDAAGTTQVNGGTVTTTGNQTFNDPVTVGADTTFISNAAGNISFNNTLDGAFNVNVNTTGTTTFGGKVGNTTPLTSLTTDAGGTTAVNGGLISTTKTQTFNDAVTVGTTDATFTSSGAAADGNITFNSTLDGPNGATINTAGTTKFVGKVGNTTPLAFLTTDAAGTTVVNGGLVKTSGNQTFNDPVTVGAATTFSSTASGNITFNNTLDGAFAVDVNTAGTTAFNNVVGGTTPLTSLTTDAPGTTTINTTAVTTTGNQTYNDPVTLGQNTNLTGTTVTFNGTVTGATKNLTVTGNAVFGDAAADTVTGLGTLTVTGNTTVNTNTVTSTGKQDYQGNLTIGAPAGTATLTTTNSDIFVGGTTTLASNLTTSNGTGNTTFTGTVDGTFDLVLNSTGNTTFTSAVGGTTPLRSVTTDAGGTTNVNGGTVATTKTQTYNDAVVVGANTTFSSTGAGADGNINFASTLDGAKTVTVNTAGTTTFGGAVGGTTPLTSLTTDAAGTTAVNGGSVKTTGTQTYGDAVTVGNDVTFTSTGNQQIEFSSTLNGTKNVTINTGGLTKFGGEVGTTTPLQTLTTDAPGTVAVNGGKVYTVGNMTFNENSLVPVAVDVTGGPFTALFKSVLAGDVNQTGTGNITFEGPIIATGKQLIFCTNGLITIEGTIGAAAVSFDCGGTIDLNGKSVTTVGEQTYVGNVILTENTILTASKISFSGKINSDATPRTLQVNTNLPEGTTIAGDVGTLSILQNFEANGILNFNGGTIKTIDFQKFNGPVNVTGANTTFTSTSAGVISFNNTLNGLSNVGVNTAGTTTFGGAVGGTTPLTSLTTDAAGTTTVSGGLVKTTGAQTFLDPVTLGASATFTSTGGGNITFDKTVTGAAQDATVNTGGVTQFNGAVNVNNLTTDAAGSTTVNTATVTTTQNQTFNDAVNLTADATFNAGANATFANTLTGPTKNAAVNAPGVTTFGGVVNVNKLTTDAAGTTTVSTSLVKTTTAQVFNDPVKATVNSTFEAGTDVTFNKSLTSTTEIAVSAANNSTFNGAVSVGTFTINGPGQSFINGGNVTSTGFQNYLETVTLGANTTFQAGGPVTFVALNGNFTVTVATAQDTTFNGAVNVGNLTTNGGGRTVVNTATMTTTGKQTYDDAVLFNQATTFKAGSDIQFNSTLTSDCKDMVLESPGTVTFNGAVEVGSITSDTPGSVVVNTATVTTCTFQKYADPVLVQTSATFASKQGGEINFGNTLTGANQKIAVNTGGNTSFNAAVTAGSLETDAAGTTTINAGTVTTSATQTYRDPVTVAKNSTLNSTGNVTFDQTVNGTTNLIVLSPSILTFNGAVSLANLTTDAGGSTQVNSGLVTTTGTQNYGDSVNFPGNGTLNGNTLVFGNDVKAVSGDLVLNLTGGTATQPGGGITANTIGLNGTGTFTLPSKSNDAMTNIRVNMASGGATFYDANNLTVDPVNGVSLLSGNVTLQAGENMVIRSSDVSTTPAKIISLGNGVFTASPGLTSASRLTFNAEATATKLVFGSQDGSNNRDDTFVIRPSVSTPITIFGSAPVPPIPAGQKGDRLGVDLSIDGTNVFNINGFAYNGQDGFYTFDNGAKIEFFSIESIAGSSIFGFVVQTSERGDGTTLPDSQKPSYAVRTVLNQNGQNLGSSLKGSGIPQNPFVVSPQLVNPSSTGAPPRMSFGDVNGDGVADLIIANGPGDAPLITVINGQTAGLFSTGSNIDLANLDKSQVIAQFFAFEPQFVGGVNVASASVMGNGRAQIIVGAERGGGPRVRVFDFVNGEMQQAPGKVGNFFAYEPTFTGGVRVAAGDINGDGMADIMIVPGDLGGPRVVVVDGLEGTKPVTNLTGIQELDMPLTLVSFFTYDPSFRGGMFVDSGDFNNDGVADLLVGAGRGGAPHIQVYSGKDIMAYRLGLINRQPVALNPVVNFFASFGDDQSKDPLFPSALTFNGVGGVSFGALSSPSQPRDILVSSPRGVDSAIQRYSFTRSGNTFTLASVQDLLSPEASTALGIPAIVPSPDDLTYGGSVGGFLDRGIDIE